jgi:hypothetical protein
MMTAKKVAPASPASSSAAFATMAGLAGWAVPGLGHLLLKRWVRGLVYFSSVCALAATGLALRGNIFSPSAADPFDFLGFLANLGTGSLYLVARSLDGVPDVSRAAGDYGTRFFATAGVLNVLFAIEAYEIGCGRKR